MESPNTTKMLVYQLNNYTWIYYTDPKKLKQIIKKYKEYEKSKY